MAKKERKIDVFTRGAKKYPSYRVHTAGPRSSGKPVSPYFADKKLAIEHAKRLAKRTGRTYLILQPVVKIQSRKRK